MAAVDGSVMQSAHDVHSADYEHERIYYPVLGIVVSVHFSDDRLNRSALEKQDLRGSQIEAEVLVVNDELDNIWRIPNVVVLPHGASGIDNFHEEIPRPCTGLIDGSAFSGDWNFDYEKVDGDWCIVSFIGGQIDQPVMTHWFPHPGNRQDPGTVGSATNTRIHSNRFLKRFQGTRVQIDQQGNVTVDTNESNTQLKPKEGGGLERVSKSGGGNIQLDINSEATLEINFNEAEKFQNPPKPGEFIREDVSSRLTMDDEFVTAVAGKVIQILGRDDVDSVQLGENPTDHAVKGEAHQVTFNALVTIVNEIISKFNSHTHTMQVPSPGVSEVVTGTANDMPDADLSDKVIIE